MEFSRYQGSLATLDVDLLAVPVVDAAALTASAVSELDAALGGALQRIALEESFEGKEGQTLLVHTLGRVAARRVLLIGVGKNSHPGRLAGAIAGRKARELRVESVAIAAAVAGSESGVLLGAYTYDRHRTEGVKEPRLARVVIAGAAPTAAPEALAVAEGINLARDLVNGPPNVITPTALADAASALAVAHGLECTIFDKAELQKRGMNLILAVSAGSDEEPRLIHLTYRPKNATAATPSVALVGKGLTFDAGGLNLKPSGSIEDMKIDMAGGAAVLGAMRGIAALQPNLIVHGIIPSSENLLGGSAYKLGDVIKSYLGKTVEVLNTDAEGRLILADALAYANEQKPREIVDLATLTGAICVALGNDRAGLFGDDGMCDALQKAADTAGEAFWRMPLDKALWKQMKSDVADMKNVGKRWGGAITAALFLQQFTGATPWGHLDIAGPAWSEGVDGHIPKGGTGFAVATLVEYVRAAATRLAV